MLGTRFQAQKQSCGIKRTINQTINLEGYRDWSATHRGVCAFSATCSSHNCRFASRVYLYDRDEALITWLSFPQPGAVCFPQPSRSLVLFIKTIKAGIIIMNDMRFNEVLIQLCKESEPKMIDIGNLRTHIHPMFYLKKNKKNLYQCYGQ